MIEEHAFLTYYLMSFVNFFFLSLTKMPQNVQKVLSTLSRQSKWQRWASHINKFRV